MKIDTAVVFTNHDVVGTEHALTALRAAAARRGITLLFDVDESERHGLVDGEGIRANVDLAELAIDLPDISIVFGGDGSTLRSLRTFAGTGVPTFAFNYGTIGFLTTVEGDELESGLELALTGNFDVLKLPALRLHDGGLDFVAVNDIAFDRPREARVAELAYELAGKPVGQVRCDGLVASTPAGSTGYNLANNGPILAWGVEGFVVSFIAPHTLTARALVAAPGDELRVTNVGKRDPVEIMIDGR
ncbi:MAG: NAD(+)/NADH kinase, partial [Thermoleophilaceae bacterium]|nr:NAD(+)/NADH kinase [Thermoleophilaceae bacterium]